MSQIKIITQAIIITLEFLFLCVTVSMLVFSGGFFINFLLQR